MPTYDYQCRSCEHTWEQDQSIKAAPIQDCPKCGQPEAKRMISGGTGFQLKGSGWASDGYGS